MFLFTLQLLMDKHHISILDINDLTLSLHPLIDQIVWYEYQDDNLTFKDAFANTTFGGQQVS